MKNILSCFRHPYTDPLPVLSMLQLLLPVGSIHINASRISLPLLLYR